MLDEGIGNKFGSYMSNEHLKKKKKKPHLIIIAKGRRVQRYEQSSTFSCDCCTNHFQK
jgi:hypothetical protein